MPCALAEHLSPCRGHFATPPLRSRSSPCSSPGAQWALISSVDLAGGRSVGPAIYAHRPLRLSMCVLGRHGRCLSGASMRSWRFGRDRGWGVLSRCVLLLRHDRLCSRERLAPERNGVAHRRWQLEPDRVRRSFVSGMAAGPGSRAGYVDPEAHLGLDASPEAMRLEEHQPARLLPATIVHAALLARSQEWSRPVDIRDLCRARSFSDILLLPWVGFQDREGPASRDMVVDCGLDANEALTLLARMIMRKGPYNRDGLKVTTRW